MSCNLFSCELYQHNHDSRCFTAALVKFRKLLYNTYHISVKISYAFLKYSNTLTCYRMIHISLIVKGKIFRRIFKIKFTNHDFLISSSSLSTSTLVHQEYFEKHNSCLDILLSLCVCIVVWIGVGPVFFSLVDVGFRDTKQSTRLEFRIVTGPRSSRK